MADSRIIFGSPGQSTGRMIWKGAWSSIVNYFVNDVVSNGGNSYIAIADSFNVATSVTTSWNLMASGNAVTSVASKVGAVTLVGTDISDHDAALGVPLLDASGFLKAAQENTSLNSQVGTSYTLVAADRGKLVTLSNASPVALTVPAASGSFAAGWFCAVTNLGAGLVTLTPTGTVDGAASITLKQFQSITLTSVGGNWITLRNYPGGSTGSGAVVLATSPTFVTSAITPVLVLNGNTLNGVTGSGTAVVTNTSPTIATPTITGTAATANIVLNGASTGAGAALTVGGTSSTTGGISVFIGAAGASNEMLSIVPADGSTAATRVRALSVRALASGFLTGTEAASISNTGAIAGLSLALGGGTALTTTNRTGTGNLVLATAPTVSDPTLAGVTAVKRIRSNQGTAVVVGDFAITGLGLGSWGTTASITAVSGTDTAGSITISCSGTGQTINAAVRLTFHDGAFPASPVVMAVRGEGNAPAGPATVYGNATTSTTFGVNGVPVAGTSYVFYWFVIGS